MHEPQIENTIQPSPSLAVINSAATTVVKVTASEMRSPVITVGRQDGNTTWRNTCCGEAPQASAAWMRCWLTPRTPAVAAIAMVGNAARNSSATFEVSPVPSQRISSTM